MFRNSNLGVRRTDLIWLVLLGLLTACSVTGRTGSVDVGNVQEMAWQSDHFLWVCGSKGLARWDVYERSVTVFMQRCGSLLVTSGGKIWRSDGNSLSLYNEQSWQTFPIKDELLRSYDGGQLLEAKDGSIWLGTTGLGRYEPTTNSWQIVIPPLPDVDMSPPQSRETIREVQKGGITDLLQAIDGAIWVASTSGVIRLYGTSQQTWTVADGLADNVVRTLLQTQDGAIWVGTEYGVSHWDGSAWKTLPNASAPDTDGDYIVDMLLEASDGSVWATTWDGVARWNGSSWQSWPIARNLTRHDGVRALLETSDGLQWVATWGNGVSRWDGINWCAYTTADGLTSNYVSTLLESPDGTLWAGLVDGSVDRYNPTTDSWQPFSVD